MPDDDGAFLRIVNFPPRGIGARTLESLQDRARAAGTSLWQAACEGAIGGKAGSSLTGFLRLIESLRAATVGLPLPEAVAHVNEGSGLVAHYRAEKDGQDRLENLEELVNAADGFLREADLAVDAPYIVGTDLTLRVELCDCPECEISPGSGRCIDYRTDSRYSIPVTVPPPTAARTSPSSNVSSTVPGSPQAVGRSSP